MKKIIAILLTFLMIFGIVTVASENSPSAATPTDLTNTITVTKDLKGEIWQVRCDVMDNTTFIAGGGYWKADITNHANVTSKEGHRSNHCGDWENWVLFVNEEGVATGLYQLKSGSTGGTLPSIVYRSPGDLANIPESQLIYDPTSPGDPMTYRLLTEVFTTENIMGVYFPYMVVDVNGHASLSGEGEHKTAQYKINDQVRYDADAYQGR